MQEIVLKPQKVNRPSDLNNLKEDSVKDSKLESNDEGTFQTDLNLRLDLASKGSTFSIEDSKTFLENLYFDKDLILNESWDFSETIHGKITNINDQNIQVDCLIDRQNSIIQQRVFPKMLFQSLKNFNQGSLVLIKTRMKKGSCRLDIYPGDLIVKNESFNLQNEWDTLRNKGLNNTLSEW